MADNPKLEKWAYVSYDGHLYEVVGEKRSPGALGMPVTRIEVMDCVTEQCFEFLQSKIVREFKLVRRAPRVNDAELSEAFG